MVGIPFRVPREDLLVERVAAVLAVIYLIFNEGYNGRGELAPKRSGSGEQQRCSFPAKRRFVASSRSCCYSMPDEVPCSATASSSRSPIRTRPCSIARGSSKVAGS
jgi:hypothetical protein